MMILFLLFGWSFPSFSFLFFFSATSLMCFGMIFLITGQDVWLPRDNYVFQLFVLFQSSLPSASVADAFLPTCYALGSGIIASSNSVMKTKDWGPGYPLYPSTQMFQKYPCCLEMGDKKLILCHPLVFYIVWFTRKIQLRNSTVTPDGYGIQCLLQQLRNSSRNESDLRFLS